MRSGWPHSEDGQGMTPADQRRAPFGPDVSWPTGYSELEHRGGGYRYPAPQADQLPDRGQGSHPYAAFSARGYGDDGYTTPATRDRPRRTPGIAGTQDGTRIRGVRPGRTQAGLPRARATPSPAIQPATSPDYPQEQGYEPVRIRGVKLRSGRARSRWPTRRPPSAEDYHGADRYQQPWDYDQPLRYDGEEVAYPAQDGYPADGDYQSVNYLSGAYPTRVTTVPAATSRPPTTPPPTTAPTTRCRASTVPATTCPASSAPATSRRSATTSRATAASPTTTLGTRTRAAYGDGPGYAGSGAPV